jgi:glycosyltransferase involved in cell wall biosynthesis
MNNNNHVLSQPIQVLFLASVLPIGGAERTWIDFIPFFDNRKFQPTMICFKDRGAFGEEMARRGVNVIDHFMKSKYDFGVLLRLLSYIKKNDIKIVYTLDHDDVMFWGRLAARIARVPACFTVIHTTNRRENADTINFWGKMLMPFTDKLVATAEGSRQHLRQQGIADEQLHLIINGVDIDNLLDKKKNTKVKRSDFHIPDNAKVVGILATFKPEKAHTTVFLEAAKIILKTCPQTYFLLIGDGVERPQIEAKINSLGIGENVIITGFREDAAEILGILDISTLASFPRVETFSLAILESMAVGLPCVVTDVGSLSEMIFNDVNGYVVPHSDPQEFATAVIKILQNDDLARQMGEKSQQIAFEKFHRQRMTKDTEEMFETVLTEKGYRLVG